MSEMDIFLGPIATTFLIGITALLLLIWYSSKKQTYWKKRGIPYVKPIPILGSIWDTFRRPFYEVEEEWYSKFGPIYGYYEGDRALLSVGDTKLLRDIFVKDFQFFANRRPFTIGDEILDNVLTFLEGEDWRRVRTIITPTFSTGKLKRMLSIFEDCARTLVQNFKKAAHGGEYINVKPDYGAFAMDVIASSAFSTKIDSHNDPENKFVQTARKVFGTKVNWRLIMLFLFPGIAKFFGIRFIKPSVTKFFSDITIQIINERKKTGQKRNDFLQLLVDTAKEVDKEERGIDADKESDLTSNYGQEIAGQKVFKNTVTKNLSMNELIAQCVVFFLAGFENIALLLTCASYSLATNQDVQEKAFQEITQCLKETNGELTYEAMQKMKYLDNVISETLRLYPPSSRVERKVESDYKLGDTGITVPKDMIVSIPIYALHKDPKLFSDPDSFNPNRFTAEERGKRDPYAYLPFGAGPRNCVGMRFALMEVKTCLVYVISHFNIKTCPKTQIPIQFHAGLNFIQPKDIFLRMELRKNSPLVH